MTVNKNPTQLIELKLEGLKNTGTAKEWQCEQLMVDYLHNDPAMKSDNVRMAVKSAIRGFYHANWRDLNPNAGEDISQPEAIQRSPKMQRLNRSCGEYDFQT